MRALYFTCPIHPEAQVLAHVPDDAGRHFAQECLMCGQQHVIDSETGMAIVHHPARAEARRLLTEAA